MYAFAKEYEKAFTIMYNCEGFFMKVDCYDFINRNIPLLDGVITIE